MTSNLVFDFPRALTPAPYLLVPSRPWILFFFCHLDVDKKRLEGPSLVPSVRPTLCISLTRDLSTESPHHPLAVPPDISYRGNGGVSVYFSL